MAKFFVGQRVRIVRDIGGETPHLVGRESTIVAIGEMDLGGGFEIDLAIDPEFSFCADELEPILPEGHRPSEFTTLADLLESLEVTA